MNNSTNIIDDLRLLEPWTVRSVAPWLLLVVGVVALFWFLMRRRKKGAAELSADGVAAAQEDALAELEKARAMMAPENSRPYGIEVSNIVRRYIERRFGIFAPRRSTEEFLLEASESANLKEAHRALLAEFLGCCDVLKFGRARAELAELEAQHSAAVRFVMETRA